MDTGLWNFLWTPYRSDSTCVVQDCGEKFEGDKRPNGDTVVSGVEKRVAQHTGSITHNGSTHLHCVLYWGATALHLWVLQFGFVALLSMSLSLLHLFFSSVLLS